MRPIKSPSDRTVGRRHSRRVFQCPATWVVNGLITLIAIFTILVTTGGVRAFGQQVCAAQEGEWPCYGRDSGGARFSPLTQINPANVGALKVAWTYRTGDMVDPKNGPGGAFECTPILLEGALYLCTPFSRIIALDAGTGKERWTYDPGVDRSPDRNFEPFTSRGVAAWTDASLPQDDPRRGRIFFGTYDARLIALYVASGKPCEDFGKGGQVDLKQGVGEIVDREYNVTSPPAVIHGLVIIGSSIADNHRVTAPSGVVRAYDARTGALRWRFEPVPRDKTDPARKTWAGASADRTGAGNAWSVLSIDPERNLVFVPTGSASPDFYGGERIGSNRYADSVVALRADTGKVVWSFQAVHHDLWDYDVPAQPALITVRRNGRDVPAVAVATKMGNLFFLDRDTGKPLFPVEERLVPRGGVAGEKLSPTQPFPVLPHPLVPQTLSPDDAWGLTPADREAARRRIASLRCGGIFTPPSLQGTVLYPGNLGGMNWSGTSFDPIHGLLIANTNRLATIITLIPHKDLMRPEQWDAEHKAHPGAEYGRQTGTPYVLRREWLLSAQRLPQTSPPWGTLTAVDLATGALRWQVPLGTIPGLESIPGSDQWGSINLGGSFVTASGLVFIAATMDDCLRAFDVETGKELWKTHLPAGGQAAPMTYQWGGKQYVVICAGGHSRLGTPVGDYVIAYALP